MRQGETYSDLACGFEIGTSRVYQRRRRVEPDTGRYRRLSAAQQEVNAELENWRILRKIRSGPSRVSELVAAVQP